MLRSLVGSEMCIRDRSDSVPVHEAEAVFLVSEQAKTPFEPRATLIPSAARRVRRCSSQSLPTCEYPTAKHWTGYAKLAIIGLTVWYTVDPSSRVIVSGGVWLLSDHFVRHPFQDCGSSISALLPSYYHQQHLPSLPSHSGSCLSALLSFGAGPF